MKTRKKFITQPIALLLILLLGAAFVVPPGMDLELCFGPDGHIKFSLNGCLDGASPKSAPEERPSLSDTAHHDDCLDVAVVCSTALERIRAGSKTDSHTFKLQKDPSRTPLLFSKSLADSAGAYLDSNVSPLPYDDFPSPHLVSLRAVVLLI